MDAVTRRWIRNASDEKAVANGCRFDERRGQFVIDWAAHYLTLYEGEYAGQSLIAHDWQIEVTMRLFGWVKPSERWHGRNVRRFTQASIWIPKKNKKSPTLAWWGLYLLCGDGESGQKVYFGAKDGSQAREIAGKHAVEMVLASDALMSECEINKALMQITHLPTRSVLKPLSSSDSKSQKAKEGINGSVLIDETHVVDRAFMKRICRAGISRMMPLQIEVSTAGNDPESYGRERYEYGKQVEDGTFEDERLLFVSYEAPQDSTDEQIAADPVRYGQMANPAWGHTVNEDEYLDDCHRSQKSITDFADFKMYRLNVWQQSSNPWLRKGDWAKCKRDFTAKTLAGRECWLGLDLSKTQDMSSAVLIFPDVDEAFYQLPYFWLPKEEAVRKNHLAPFLQWESGGYLTLTPGDVIDYRTIREQIAELNTQFRIKEVIYDRTYAEELTQQLAEEEGIPRFTFPQTIMAFASPTADYERLVIAGSAYHNNHPVLNWQAGHVQVRSDVNNNKRPVKPKHGDIRKVDGIVAAIMGLDRAMQRPDTSVYTFRGLQAI